MIITDYSQTPAVNRSVNLNKVAVLSDGRSDCVQVLATGTLSAGTVKMTVSQDNQNFYPLNDENGIQIILTPCVPVYLRFANLFIKCDLTDVTSSDLKVQVQ